MTDLTRKGNFAEKKTYSVSAARLKHGDVSSTAAVELFNLPANALITNAYVIVKTVGQDTLTVDYGFDGGNELGNDLDVHDAVGVITVPFSVAALTLAEGAPNTLTSGTVSKSPLIDTGTGKTVTAKFSADPSAGDFVFIIEYIEYDLGNGKLTEYSPE